MLLFTGLGNPGASYAHNRHNIGFMALDVMAQYYRFPAFRARFQGLSTEGTIEGEKIILLKPQTYMNESGRSVQEAAKFYRLEPADIVVFHDELDLEPGRMRVKSGGGSAGHNGLRSIQAHMGPDFRRVRLGIGHPGHKALVHNYVLGDFAKSEHAWVNGLCDAIAKHAGLLVKKDDASFQNHVHLATKPSGSAV